MAACRTPVIIVLALGAGAPGFPVALRLLADLAGRNPLLDIATCVVAMAVATAHVLGTILLARFVREAGAGGGARITDRLARLTLAVSVGAASLVFACLLAAPGGPGLLVLYRAVGTAGVVPVLVVAAATVLPFARPLLRAAPASRPTGTERWAGGTTRMARFAVAGTPVVVAGSLLAAFASGAGHHARRGGSLVSVSVAAALLGATILGRFILNARNAADAVAATPLH